jgi:putative heme-binding domain-containing protein
MSLRLGLVIFVLLGISLRLQGAVFDGKTLEGWEGQIGSVWRVESGEIVAGQPGVKMAKNDFLATTRTYGNFELKLEYKRGANNGGIQFRSHRIPGHHEIRGYQADFAPGIDGSLYDESRRNRFLAQPAAEVVAKLGLGEWNRYRIRAEGPRIRLWINEVLTVDYTEDDPLIPLEGIVAIQIHSGADEIRYRNLELEELPGPTKRLGQCTLEAGDVVGLIGGANFERSRLDPFLQGGLMGQEAGRRPKRVRNLAWEGDTVYEQWRDVNFPTVQRQLEELGATVVFAQFGLMESMEGEGRLGAFVEAYEKLLQSLARSGRRIVVVSPTPFEKPSLEKAPDLTRHNVTLRQFVLATRQVAERLGGSWVDVFSPFVSLPKGAPRLTGEDGLHLSAEGQDLVAREILRQSGLSPLVAQSESLHTAMRELERLWFDYWRTMNWAFLGGDRTSVAFSHDWKDTSKRLFPEEMKAFESILEEAEANVARALAGQALQPVRERSPVAQEPPSVKAETPEEELATLQVHPDYQVNLFASEKDGIGKVVQIRWDEKGRLWALCIPDYPQVKPGAPPRNRLVICEDTDRDGRADKTTVFADQLEMPLGFELAPGGVYLATASSLWFLSDPNGTDREQGRQLVLGGFGTGDTHQTINSLSWGFGGELWFTQGHSIYSRVESAFGIERHDRAGLWRYRTRTGRLDTFFNNSTAGANNWGVLTDDYGQVFHKEGAANGGFYSVPGLSPGDLTLSGVAMQMFVSRDTKTVGIDLIGTRHFPEELQGAVVIGGVYNNSLQIHSLVRDESGFKTVQLPNIISTKNRAFRPCDVRMGPDGAIYFADWYNVIVGHYQASYRHPDRDLVHGRIWRVIRKDRPLVQAPRLEGLGPKAWLEHVDSPERWVRYQAKRLLFGSDSKAVLPELDAWLAGLDPARTDSEFRRLQALSLFEAHETPRLPLLRSLLRASDPRVRAYATRVLSNWARLGALPDALEWLAPQVEDGDWMVRLEGVVAASYLNRAEAAPLALRALNHPWSPYLEHALTKTLSFLKPHWLPQLQSGQLQFQREEHLLTLLKNAKDPRLLPVFRREIARIQAAGQPAGNWLAALVEVGEPADLARAFQSGSREPRVLDALLQAGPNKKPQGDWEAWRGKDPVGTAAPVRPEENEGLLQGLRGLMNDPNGELAQRAMRLAGVWKVRGLRAQVGAIAEDSKQPELLRRAAILGLADYGGEESVRLFTEVSKQGSSEALREAGFEALLKVKPAMAANQALERLKGAEVAQVKGILKPLVSREAGKAALLAALKSAQPPDAASAKAMLRALNESGVSDKALVQGLMSLAGVSSAGPVYSSAYIRGVAEMAKTAGDPLAGRTVFEQTGCLACHAVNEVGGKIGPSLSALSRGLPLDMIVTEVIWPSINIKEGYEAATVTLKDGTVVSGFKQTDTETTLSIRDMNTGEIRTLQRADAASVQVGGSVMPEGLTASLSEKQLADLIRYLASLGQ